MKLWKYDKPFTDKLHIDKWLTVVCINESKNNILIIINIDRSIGRS